jgi:23S rRNA (adenine2030-N6)-methyltransferase
MNYRHGFHAGNFADLAKHAALLTWLRMLRAEGAVVRVIDTHAGAGFYDLSNPDFARSKEAEAGIKYLLGNTVPDSLKPLSDYVRAKNNAAGFKDYVGVYPGSPVLVLDHSTTGDAYVGCELRSDDFTLLQHRIAPRGQAIQSDGYAKAVELAADGDARKQLYLIDPPFEQPGDYAAIVTTLREVLAMQPQAGALVWLPLKDLETFDGFLRHLERELPETDTLVTELRLRSLWNPMKMNGCALVAVNAPEAFAPVITAIGRDVVAVFGEATGVARTWFL